MAKRRISRSSKMRLTFFGTLSIIAIFYFLFSLLFNVYTIYDLTNDKQNLQNSLLKLQEEAEELKTDIEKFNDPEYLADYAREHYYYTKKDEYVIKMDEIEETDELIDTLNLNINKKYIILGLSLFMVIFFIYILKKGKKRKKKGRK